MTDSRSPICLREKTFGWTSLKREGEGDAAGGIAASLRRILNVRRESARFSNARDRFGAS
jgi:hypothetical protein